MSTEQGIVKQVESGWAWVKAKRLGASSGCGCYDHCTTIEGGNKMVIRAVNQAQARKGDVVVLYLSTSAKFKCIATVYLLPVFGLLAGAFSATFFGYLTGLGYTWVMAPFTIAGLAAAIVLMRFLASRMANQEDFTPVVKRIVSPAREPINLN
jgi:sigma-E factor negative regulatory protein RseC